MLKFTNITGKKEVKGFTEEVIIASPTPGSFKITPLAAKKLGVKDGSFAVIVTGEDEAGNAVAYIGKGLDGVPLLNEDGSHKKNDAGRVLFEENTASGAIVRQASAGSPLLNVTAAMAWQVAGADADNNTYFKLGEGVEGETKSGNVDENGEQIMITTTFFPLVLDRKEPKGVRKVKSTDAEGNEVETEVSEEEDDFTSEEV